MVIIGSSVSTYQKHLFGLPVKDVGKRANKRNKCHLLCLAANKSLRVDRGYFGSPEAIGLL
jgi:hypothetical protein